MFRTILKKKIIKGFDVWSSTYTNDVTPKLERRGHGYNQLAKKIISFLEPKLRANILEIGAGSGVLGSKVIHNRPDLKIIGIDISRNMLFESKQLDMYEALFHCDAENIPFQDNTFEFIFSAYMLHSALDAKKCLQEIWRTGKPNARVVIVDLFRTNKRIPFFSVLKDNVHSVKYEHGAISNYHRPDEFEEILQCTKLQLVEKYKLDTNECDDPVGQMFHYFFAAQIEKTKSDLYE